MKSLNQYIFLLFFLLFISCNLFAQIENPSDTFFLLKKKGLLKKLGESIYRDIEIETDVVNVVKNVDPFLNYDGKRIRFISIAPTGFYTIVHDTVDGKKGNFLESVGDFFHKNTLPRIVRKNLFFKEGDKILPRELSDNEQFLREQPFFRDARILVLQDSVNATYVDVVILTRDVFSLGASADVSNLTKVESVITEENLGGSGNKFEISSLYDKERIDNFGFGASYTKRNLKGTFINWTTGFNTYNTAFNSGRQEENIVYTAFNKPLLSRYNAWTGAAYFGYSQNKNQYDIDSVFNFSFKYKNLITDVWGGFNIGYKNKKDRDSDKRLRHFVAMRGFYNQFYKVPDAFKNSVNYSNLNGFLASYSLYKQNFYRTNFIYGFGRNEDIPKGLNATVLAGFTNKQGVRRPYYGAEFDATDYSKKGIYTNYTFRLGTFINQTTLEDIDLLIGVNRFTKLNKLHANWRNRNFFTFNFAKQFNFNYLLNKNLYLQSIYGQPNYRGTSIETDTRTTLKVESVFFNLKKFLGFRFAPFAFTDLSLLKPLNEAFNKSIGYSAIGGGIRARNENLVFGTIELKGYYFPRKEDGLKNWRIEVASKLRFNFNTSFIRRPEFVSPN
jgi:hypothetical protein